MEISHLGAIDTLGGNSGSGVLDSAGKVVGVHTNGGCTASGGFNFGMRISSIRAFSPIVAADCIFNWAETKYPNDLKPAGAQNIVGDGFVYRYYSTTKTYVGLNLSSNRIFFMGPDGIQRDQGALSTFKTTASCN